MKHLFFILSLLLILVKPTVAQVKVTQERISTVDTQALTVSGKYSNAINGRTYQKDALATFQGYQYIAYYDSERHVCLSRRELPFGEWKTIRFLDYYFESDDSHNVVSMGICPNDGTIHLAFDHHVHPLHYRVSKKGLATHPESETWSTSSFGPIVSELEKGMPIKITYPKFWPTPDGNLQFNYRVRGSGNGDRMLVDYNAKTGTWENTRQIDSALGYFEDELGESETRCSYPNGYDYDQNGNLHVTWVWRENSQGANHDLCYLFSEDGGFTWKNNAGETLPEVANVNSDGLVVQSIPRVWGLMNDHGQVIDSKGRVHAVMFHANKETIEAAGSKLGETRWGPPGSHRYFHYWRDENGAWHSFQMPMKVGNRPKVFADENDNLIMIYAGEKEKAGVDRSRRESDLIIAVATAKNNWKDWHIAYSLKGPFMNDMLGDVYRWESDEILSIMLQNGPSEMSKPSELRVVDLSIEIK